MPNPLRSERQGGARHRVHPRHRQVDCRGAGPRRRQGGAVQPQGRGLRAGAGEFEKSGFEVLAQALQRLAQGGAAGAGGCDHGEAGAASTSWLPTRPPIRTTGRSPAFRDEAFDKIIGNNVKSVLWLAGMTLPGMAERGGGSFIIVGSIGGLIANTVIGAYGMSKAADHHLVRNLAAEWGPKNVRVNAIAPGLIKTEFATCVVGGRRAAQGARGGHAAAPPGRAARDRRHRRLPRLRGRRVHHRAVHRRRRRRDPMNAV